jgi:hypothetical protein
MTQQNDIGSEREVKKTVVYEHATRESSRSWAVPAVIIGVIVVALLIVIFLRIDW